MKDKISIIVLNYNGKAQLAKNLPSILRNKENSEVILVDNNSTDGSVEFVKSSFPEVKIVSLGKNYGFCRGLNEGAKAAQGSLLLFLNNDIEVTEGFLNPIIKHFEDSDVFGVSPKVLRPLQNNLNESIILGSFAGGVLNAKFSDTQKLHLPNTPLEVFSVCGAAFMIDKEKFFEIGGLDEMLYPFYYEETDLSYRALKRGWKIIYEPNSVVYHLHNQTIGQQFSRSFALWSYRKNQYLCVWKNITDPWLITKHIFQMIFPKLLIPNLLEWRAFWGAVKQLPEAIRKRQEQEKLAHLSDRQVFGFAAKQRKIIKLKSQVKKILVIRPDAIGDLVLTLPAIATLKINFPKAKITALVREYTAPLLKNNPNIDEIICDYNLKKHNFDLSVNFYNQFKDTFACFLARIPYRLGDSSRILTGWMNNLRVFRKWNDFTRHEVEFNLDLLEPLGIIKKNLKINLNIDKNKLDKINILLLEQKIKDNNFLVGVHIGGGGTHNKAWNNIGYAEVINWLQREKGAKVILTGADDAAEKAEKIALLCEIKPINLVGKLKLEELVALTSKYQFYLGTDTGPTHIAAALGVPLVVIFLSKRAKPLRWGPWQTRHLAIKNFSKCERVCNPPECKIKLCTEEINPKEVIAACDQVISGGGVINREETLTHWCQKSFSILITSHPQNNSKAQALQKLLSEAGYHVSITNSFFSTKELLRRLIQDDISIIHSLDNFRNLQILLGVLLSGGYLSNRTLRVKTKDQNFKNAKEIIDLYIKKFRSSVF